VPGEVTRVGILGCILVSLEAAGSFLAGGTFDVRVEGPVAGKTIEARVRERAPVAPVMSTGGFRPSRPARRLRGTAIGSRNHPLTIEFVKDGSP
jgi:hypothetical protein